MNIELLFSVSDLNGSVWNIFTDGSITGFPDGVVINNRYPLLLAQELSRRLMESACPTSSETDSLLGCSQSFAEYEARTLEKNAHEPGEK